MSNALRVSDPDNKFIAHMELIGYSSHFTKVEQFQEGGRR
jgi:hypothetical protein